VQERIDLTLLFVNPFLLLLDQPLLLIRGVDQHGRELPVLHALDFALVGVGGQQRIDRRDLFSGETKIADARRTSM